MTLFQKTYTKEEFIRFLERNNVNDKIISKFEKLPEAIKRSNSQFEIYIVAIWNSEGKTHYDFEINYYSEDLIEYLFSSKVFKDVELSINNVKCLIENSNYEIIMNKP
jgi:hypothetical protein